MVVCQCVVFFVWCGVCVCVRASVCGWVGGQYRRAETVWGLEREKLVADESTLRTRLQQAEEDASAQVPGPAPESE